MKLTTFAVLLSCLGVAYGQMLPSDLSRLSDHQLKQLTDQLTYEVDHLRQVHIDPPPEPTEADERDRVIFRILKLQADKWRILRYRKRHLYDTDWKMPNYPVDRSMPVDTTNLKRHTEGEDLLISVPVPRWSEPEPDIIFDFALQGDTIVLLFQIQYATIPHGIKKDIDLTWRIPMHSNTKKSLVVRQFPDIIVRHEQRSSKEPEATR